MARTVTIEQRASGSYTIQAARDGVIVGRTAGIESHDEALTRARVWRDQLGYRVRDKAKRHGS